jgi:hypothetical protein
MDNWFTTFRNAPHAVEGGKKSATSGDPDAMATDAAYLLDGIPLLDAVIKDLEDVGQRFRVEAVTSPPLSY